VDDTLSFVDSIFWMYTQFFVTQKGWRTRVYIDRLRSVVEHNVSSHESFVILHVMIIMILRSAQATSIR